MEAAALDALGRRAANGDSDALEQLLVECRPMVVARCRRFFPNEFDAEDASQEALLSISRRIDTFQGRSSIATWVNRVAANASIDAYRAMKRRRSLLVEPPEQQQRGSTPSVVVGARIDLLEGVSAIDRKYAEAVLLRDMCEVEYAEIAQLLDVPLGTVKRRIHDGRQLLREAMHGSSNADTGV